MIRILTRNPSVFLLVSLVLIIALTPILRAAGVPSVLGNLLLCLTPLAGIFAVADARRERLIAIVLGIPTFVTVIHGTFTHEPYEVIHAVIIGSYYAVVAVLITRRLFRLRSVTIDAVTTAMSGYLLIGVTFAIFCAAVALEYPGSYSAADATAITGFETILYYSFVTLTTLGYGDILPVSHVARTLAVFESVFGVMYLATVIARIVSMHQAQTADEYE